MPPSKNVPALRVEVRCTLPVSEGQGPLPSVGAACADGAAVTAASSPATIAVATTVERDRNVKVALPSR